MNRVYLISRVWIIIPCIYFVISYCFFAKFNFSLKCYNENKKFLSLVNVVISFISIILVVFFTSFYRVL